MAKPLHSSDPNPKDMQFSHFGLLNDGKQSRGAFATSIVTNLLLAALVVFVGAAVKKVVVKDKNKEITFAEPVKEPPPPPPPPPVKLPPPPKLPEPPKVEPPKIKLPEEKVPDLKPIPVMKSEPVHMAPAPPKAITPPPAPKAVDLRANVAPAAIKNNDAHPSAIKLGAMDNPLKSNTGPAVSKINLGNAGAPGMNANNTGNGPRSATNVSGFGCPNCTDLSGKDRGSQQVKGVNLSVGGNGPMNSKNLAGRPVNTQLGVQQAPPPPPQQTAHVSTAAAPPKLTYKPTPVYTDEARQAHIEGAVSIRIRVAANGAVSVLGVAHGLGHGLDQSALKVAQGMRFSPALDSTGHPVDWEGVVNVNFQIAG